MNLVIVESPAKARTIEKYLGPDYRVLATFGHICDLPSKDGSVRPDEDFAMDYVADSKSAKRMKAITEAAKQAERLLLATDPDREGEAISWHVLNHLEKRRALTGTKAERVVFHEITRAAVLDAVAHPRAIDMDLVNAQQARRALDYLVGFTLSPVLWRKLPGSRSAGFAACPGTGAGCMGRGARGEPRVARTMPFWYASYRRLQLRWQTARHADAVLRPV